MAATRRELLIGLSAGLVSLQETRGETIEAARRQWATVGDIERLERMIRDVGDRSQNAIARIRRTGFAPGTFNFTTEFQSSLVPTYMSTDTGAIISEYVVPFPGSIIAVSVLSASAYAGSAGTDYVDFEVYKNDAATGLVVRIAAGSRTVTTFVTKGDYTFAAGDILRLHLANTGTPLGSLTGHTANIWVSFT